MESRSLIDLQDKKIKVLINSLAKRETRRPHLQDSEIKMALCKVIKKSNKKTQSQIFMKQAAVFVSIVKEAKVNNVTI
jgi:hypothetical protein